MSVELLTVATVILAALVVLVFTTVIALSIRRRHREIEATRVLPQARARIRRVLEHASPDRTEIEAISLLPVRLRIVLFGELVASLSGAQSNRLSSLARASGLTALAEARCRAQQWSRRWKASGCSQ